MQSLTRRNGRSSFVGTHGVAMGWTLAIVLFGAIGVGAAAIGELRLLAILTVVAALGVSVGFLVFARFEWFVLAILAIRSSLDALKFGGPAGLDPASLLSVVFLATGAVWLLSIPRSRRAPASPLVLPFTALAVAGALSIVTALDPGDAIRDVVRLATLAMIALVLNQLLDSEKRVKHLLWAVFVSAIPPLAMAAVQLASGSGLHVSSSFSRVQGTFAHPNPFAMYLTLLIILGLAILPDLSHRLKMLMIPFLATSGFFLLFTYTRSAWVATVAGLLVVGMCNGRKILGVVGLLVVVVAFTVPGVAARFADLEETSTSSGAAANSLVWRFGYWQQALQLSDSPLIGEGLSTVRASTDVEKEPHNDFIRVYVEMGIVGMAAYLWLLFSFAGIARRGLREVTRGLDRGVVAGFTGAVVAFLLLSLVSNVITQLVILWYFTAIASAAVAAPRLVSAPREVKPSVGATALVRS